jgi:hypothetical protein
VTAVPEPVGSERAPFIYFDGALSYGINPGAVQIEVGAHTAIPLLAGVRESSRSLRLTSDAARPQLKTFSVNNAQITATPLVANLPANAWSHLT